MTKFIVTGAGGFIGSNLVDRLLSLGHKVCGIDNFSTGKKRFLEGALNSPNFNLINLDLLNLPALKEAFRGGEIVMHFSANADVRFGTAHPDRDLIQNTIATHNVLEAMRHQGIKKIIFSSTGSVYGEAQVIPTPENCPFPIQTSLYGASKAACEGLISAYCEGYEFKANIYRFVSILGERYSHGHVFDFYRQLLLDPSRLKVLGDGRQRKSYLYVQDCIDAIMLCLDIEFKTPVNIFNLGVSNYCEVNDSIAWICSDLGISPQLQYSGGDRGWVGDNPFILLDTSKINSLGWKPKISIKDGITKTLKYLQNNSWLLEER